MAKITPLFPEQQPSDGADERASELNLTDERISCLACGGKLRGVEIHRRYLICPHCRFHYSMSARQRVASMADPGTFKEANRWIRSIDPLSFSPHVSYRVRLLRDQNRTGLEEATVTGACTIGGTPVVLIVLDFGFLGGSMGMVVGEKVALALELATRKKYPAVAVITSGGARIQEGVLSLMQMAKTAVAVNGLHEKGLPLISVLGNPSTGQVYASFGSLADVILAEPGAHIGFAPFRAVQQASQRHLVSEQYTSENYLQYGLVDRVVDRQELKHVVSTLLDLLNPEFRLSARRARRQPRPPIPRLEPWEMVQLARRPDRPRASDYIERMFVHFVELHGDRLQGDDETVVTGIGRLAGTTCVVCAQQKQIAPPEVVEEAVEDDSAEDAPEGARGIRPEGFRKAQRAIQLAERFKLPIITLIDTPGAEQSLDAERRGLGGAIASTISTLASVRVPAISVLIGEGGSEAALAFGVSDRVLMLQNAIYSPISPEVGAEAELRDPARADEMARALKLTSADCRRMGIVDAIVPEPEGGAHSDPDEAARLLRRSLMRELTEVQAIYPRTLVRQRQKKFRRVGEYGSRFRSAVRRELNVLQAALSATVRALSTGGSTPDETDSAVDDSEAAGSTRRGG